MPNEHFQLLIASMCKKEMPQWPNRSPVILTERWHWEFTRTNSYMDYGRARQRPLNAPHRGMSQKRANGRRATPGFKRVHCFFHSLTHSGGDCFSQHAKSKAVMCLLGSRATPVRTFFPSQWWNPRNVPLTGTAEDHAAPNTGEMRRATRRNVSDRDARKLTIR